MDRPSHIGVRIPRMEDDRLFRGEAAYVADLAPPGVLDVAIMRSREATIEIEAAAAAEGAIGVFTAADLGDVELFPDFHNESQLVEMFAATGAATVETGQKRFVTATESNEEDLWTTSGSS